MSIIYELFGEIDMLHVVIIVTTLNVSLVLTSIWMFVSSRAIRWGISHRIAKCEEAIMIIKEYTKALENDSSLNGVGIDGLHKSIQLMKKDIKRMEQSLARFAHPLDKNTEYKTVTVVNAKLK